MQSDNKTAVVGTTLGSAIERNRGLRERADQLAMRARNIVDRIGGEELKDLPPTEDIREPAAVRPALDELDRTQNGLSYALDLLDHEMVRLDSEMGLSPRGNSGSGAQGPQRIRRVGEG